MIIFGRNKTLNMKTIRTKILFLGIAVAGVIMTSCNTTVNIAKKRHSKGYYVSVSKNQSTETSVTSVSDEQVEAISVIELNAKKIELTTNSETLEAVSLEKVAPTKVVTSEASAAVAENKSEGIVSKKEARKALKKALKSAKKPTGGDEHQVGFLLAIIITILLPPLGVYLYTGNILKTLLSLILLIAVGVGVGSGLYVAGYTLSLVYSLLVLFGIL